MTEYINYIISVRDLPRRLSARKEIEHWNPPCKAEWTNGVEDLDTDSPLDLHVELQGMNDGVMVRIDGQVRSHTQCSRCARHLDGIVSIDTAEMFFDPGFKAQALAQGDEEAEDFYEIVDEQVDMEPLLRDEIVLQMRTLPLCDPPCLGICPECGIDYEQLEKDHRHEVIDPRWAALGALSAQLNEQDKDH